MACESTRSLNLNVQGRGRRTVPVAAHLIGEVSESDLALLAIERGSKPRPLVELRDRHHAVARYLAQGFRPGEVANMTGYSVSRISILRGDPAFKELVQHYTDVADSASADFVERATMASLTAVNLLQERMEDAPEDMDNSELLGIVKTTADRSGHAPISKSLNVHTTVDFGDRLEAARRRAKAAQVVDGPSD